MRRTIVLLLLLGACGGNGEPTVAASPSALGFFADQTPTPEPSPSPSPTPDPICHEELTPLLEGLQELDSRLGLGLNFEAYSGQVSDLKVLIDRVDFESLSLQCLVAGGVRVEKAFNAYADAYTTWNDCIGDTYCDNDSIDGKLQKKWAKATSLISEAEEGLDAIPEA